MKRFSGCSFAKLSSALIAIALFLSFAGAGSSASLVPRNAVFKGEVIDKKGTGFPSTIRITTMNESTGDFTGEVTWHSLNSVHKIEGRVKGSTVIFKETEYIQRGAAHLNCEYAYIFDGQTLKGNWIEPGVDFGTGQYRLQ